MFADFFKSKWLVLLLLLPMSAISAQQPGFVLELQGPIVHSPSSPAKYGPVAKSDTLWSIAKATRPSTDLSMYKTMAAIMNLNPQAFLNGDLNKVIDGSYLKLPTASQIRTADARYIQAQMTSKKKASKPTVAKSTPKKVATKVTNTSKKAVKKAAAPKANPDELAAIKSELEARNEDLLLSSETNRRLKIQLETIRIELAALKEQMAEDNQLKSDLKALIEQQKMQISDLTLRVEDAQEQAAESESNELMTWIIMGVSSLLAISLAVWFGLWLKNRNDQQENEDDNDIFESDNAVDELSEYLSVDNFSAEPELGPDPVADLEAQMSAAQPEKDVEEELDFNSALNDDVVFGSFSETANEPLDVSVSEPIMPEIMESAPDKLEPTLQNDFSEMDLTLDNEATSFDGDEVTPDLSWRDELESDPQDDEEESLIPATSPVDEFDNEFEDDLAEIDSMLAEFRTEPAPVEVARQPVDDVVDIDALLDANPAESQPVDDVVDIDALLDANPAESQPVDDVVDIDALLDANPAESQPVDDVVDIDALLDANPAESQPVDDVVDIDALLDANPAESQPVDDVVDIDALLDANPADSGDLPAAHGQTVDEMLAELDSQSAEPVQDAVVTPEPIKAAASVNEKLDDIDAMLSEFSPNAFSEPVKEQAPLDVEKAKQEEFIDIDKLLNEVSGAPAELDDEPYDQVKLDVGLDEFSSSVIGGNNIDIDDESNRIGAQLDLARAYLEIDDKEGAKSILDPLKDTGNDAQQAEVEKLLSQL